MRFITMFLVGLVVFNGCLTLFAPSFNNASMSSAGDNAIDISSDSTTSSYGDIGSIQTVVLDLFDIPLILMIFLAIGAAGLGAKFLAGGNISTTLIIGIAFFISVVMSLWSKSFSVITGLTKEYTILNGLVTIISIAIGILLVFEIIGFLSGKEVGS